MRLFFCSFGNQSHLHFNATRGAVPGGEEKAHDRAGERGKRDQTPALPNQKAAQAKKRMSTERSRAAVKNADLCRQANKQGFVTKSSLTSDQNPLPHRKYSLVLIHGDPGSPTSESLAIIELSSQSSGEGKSDSGNQGLEERT